MHRYILRVSRLDRGRSQRTIQNVDVSVPKDMTVEEVVQSIADFLEDGDSGHLYIIKTPNNLRIFSSLDNSRYPVGDNELEVDDDYEEYCRELGQPEPEVDFDDLDREGSRRFYAWRRRVKGIRKGEEVQIHQAGLEIGGEPMTMQYDLGTPRSFKVSLVGIRVPEGEEVEGKRYSHTLRPFCRSNEGFVFPSSLRFPPALRLNTPELFFMQMMVRESGVREVQKMLDDPSQWHMFRIDSENGEEDEDEEEDEEDEESDEEEEEEQPTRKRKRVSKSLPSNKKQKR